MVWWGRLRFRTSSWGGLEFGFQRLGFKVYGLEFGM